ncbi:MAG: hypothetical protein H6665_06315 [Ardenticatenaceae bacterium]|nr:hypothetical protein [Ardenticatenaceae bacterium]
MRLTPKRLFVLLFALALFVLSVRETLDPDMWWHLRTGQVIWESGAIPQTDLFSFTVPDHLWVVQQWLTDVLMWLIYQAAGLRGLSVFFALLVMATYLLVFARCAGRPYLAAGVVLLALFAASLPIGVRPQMFNIFFFALFLFLVEGVRQGKFRARAFFWLPPLTALWANMHSGYLSGVALLGVYVFGEGLQILWPWKGEARDGATEVNPRLSLGQVGLLALMMALSMLAALLNPRGIDLVLFPLFTLSSDAIQSHIVEWFSPDFRLVYFQIFAGMMALGLLAFALSRKRPSLTDLLLFLGTAGMGLISARHIPLFTVAAASVIARALLASLEGTRLHAFFTGESSIANRQSSIANLLNGLLLLLALATAVLWTVTRLQNNDQTIASRFPVAAVDYLEESGLAEQPGYNLYEWGGYLIWRGIPVFIDGRTEVYGDAFFLYYLQASEVKENWREPLDDFDVAYVLLKRSHSLGTLLLASGEWQQAYRDDLAQILVPVDGNQ